MVYVYLALITLPPIVLTGVFCLLDKKTRFKNLKYAYKQVIIGVVFGLYAIFSTEYGVPIQNGAVMNVRDAGPLCAGYIFGGPAGVIAGVIGGAYRWFCVYWGGLKYTRLACSISTLLAGVISCLMSIRIMDKKVPTPMVGLAIGATMEILHMLLILLTNLKDINQAFYFVQECTIAMVVCNGLALFLSIVLYNIINEKKIVIDDKRYISEDFGIKLMFMVTAAFIITCLFTQEVIFRITSDESQLMREVTLYTVVFMQILIFAALFVLIYQLIKKNIINNLEYVNQDLKKISDGYMETVVNVRDYEEFSELSNYINETVDTLKLFIKDAENRAAADMELATKIQTAALPHTYPRRDDIEIYANTKPAKEVGGDFYDFYMIDPFTYIFLIADVSGKGIPAALFMMRAKTLIKDMMERGYSTDKAFRKANEKLCESNGAEMFITSWLGKLDLRTGKLEYSNAGHNHPILAKKDGNTSYLTSKPNFVLAGMENVEYKTNEMILNPGDILFLYTDGVTEATATIDNKKKLYGDDRLLKTIDSLKDKSPKELCDGVYKEVLKFTGDEPQFDDITMLSVRLDELMDTSKLVEVFKNK